MPRFGRFKEEGTSSRGVDVYYFPALGDVQLSYSL